MSGQRHATIVAASTLALTLTPLIGVFEGLAWIFPILLTITIIAVTGSLVRAAGRGQGLQTLAMGAALLVVMTAGFGDGTALLLLVPTPETLGHWTDLAASGVRDIVTNAPPVEAEGGILFLTVLGVGVIAILHDMFIVGLRTPALAGLTLLTMYLVPVSVAPEATAWFWFILPAVAYLWILADDNLRRVSSFGHRFTGTGQLVGRAFPSPMARTARWSATAFIAATLLALAVIPTNTSGLIDNVADGVGGGEVYGLGDVNPWAQLSGSLNRPQEVDVLRVVTDDPSPRYLRMHVLDELDESGFGPNDYDGEAGLDELPSARGAEVYTAEIQNLEMNAPVLPVYGTPVGVDVPGDWRIDGDTQVVVGDGSDMGDVDSYTVRYTEEAPETGVLAAAGGMSPDDERWEANTAHPDVPELTDLVEREFGDAVTVHDKVLAVLDYLSPANGFEYSLQTGEAGNEQAVLDFLDSKRGFCQQYAATMAWLLRETGVAARVVIGMSQGRRVDDAWILSSHDYHAWVEVYYDGPGWVVYDPTPAAGVPGSVGFPWAAEPTDPVDEETTADPGATADPTGDPGQSPTPTAGETAGPSGLPSDGATAAAPDGAGSGFGFDWRWLLLLPVLAIPFLPMAVRALIRRSRLGPRRLSPQSAWREAEDLALDYGVHLPDTLTPRQAAGVLAQAAPEARDAATALGTATALQRYSSRGADPAGLADAVRDLRSALDKGAVKDRRYRAAFWPASLLARLSASGRARDDRRPRRAADRVREALRRRRRSHTAPDRSVTRRP